MFHACINDLKSKRCMNRAVTYVIRMTTAKEKKPKIIKNIKSKAALLPYKTNT